MGSSCSSSQAAPVPAPAPAPASAPVPAPAPAADAPQATTVADPPVALVPVWFPTAPTGAPAIAFAPVVLTPDVDLVAETDDSVSLLVELAPRTRVAWTFVRAAFPADATPWREHAARSCDAAHAVVRDVLKRGIPPGRREAVSACGTDLTLVFSDREEPDGRAAGFPQAAHGTIALHWNGNRSVLIADYFAETADGAVLAGYVVDVDLPRYGYLLDCCARALRAPEAGRASGRA